MEIAMYKHILIPTDGSELAQRGVDHGLQLAKALGAKAILLMSTDPLPLSGIALGAGWVPSGDEIKDFNAAASRFAADILASAKTSAGELGVEAETVYVPDARAADAILKVAEDKGCDLIVMASHGRRGVERMLLGSQTMEVLAHAAVPVLVVH
jgi:nucleotide-binding universal stress UspA family protein